MTNPKTRLIHAAINAPPNESWYAANARGLATASRSWCSGVEAASSTSAASGSSTTALRKNVVNPSVSPNPGRTVGCPSLMVRSRRGAAVCRRLLLAVNQQHRPGRCAEQPGQFVGELTGARDSDDQHAFRRLLQPLLQSLCRQAEPHFRPDLQAMCGARLRARIEQGSDAGRALGSGCLLREHVDIDRFGRKMPQNAG